MITGNNRLLSLPLYNTFCNYFVRALASMYMRLLRVIIFSSCVCACVCVVLIQTIYTVLFIKKLRASTILATGHNNCQSRARGIFRLFAILSCPSNSSLLAPRFCLEIKLFSPFVTAQQLEMSILRVTCNFGYIVLKY